MKLLVAIDGSVLSLGALHHALQQARDGHRLALVLAHVQAGASLYDMVVAKDERALEQAAQEAGLAMLEEAQALCQAARVAHECVVEAGEAAQTLAALALQYHCDGIVMGARGKGGHRSTALGSVAHALLYRTLLPVTLVRTPAPAPGTDPSEMTIDRTMPLVKR
jgi:nucleotide-binding universal stress UspA family protein